MSDQSFLLAFALCAVSAATAAQLWRILALNRSDLDPRGSHPSTPPTLTPVEAAYIAGGRQLALTVAQASGAGLSRHGELAVHTPADGENSGRSSIILGARTSVDGPNEPGADDQAVVAALYALASDLRARGLLLPSRRRQIMALACAPLAVVDLTGLSRLAVVFAAGRTDTTLAVATGFVALICAGILCTVPHGTRLGLDLTRATELRAVGDAAALSGPHGGQPAAR